MENNKALLTDLFQIESNIFILIAEHLEYNNIYSLAFTCKKFFLHIKRTIENRRKLLLDGNELRGTTITDIEKFLNQLRRDNTHSIINIYVLNCYTIKNGSMFFNWNIFNWNIQPKYYNAHTRTDVKIKLDYSRCWICNGTRDYRLAIIKSDNDLSLSEDLTIRENRFHSGTIWRFLFKPSESLDWYNLEHCYPNCILVKCIV